MLDPSYGVHRRKHALNVDDQHFLNFLYMLCEKSVPWPNEWETVGETQLNEFPALITVL